MSNGAYAGLRLAVRAAETPAEDENETCTDEAGKTGSKGKQKDEPKMTEASTIDDTALAAARAEGFKAANERNAAVVASEHYAGREKLAANLLGNDKLSAADIIAALAEAPAPVAVASATDPDAAARAEMRDALAESGNSNVDANAGAKPAAAQADNGAVWDRAIANITPGRKAG